jgi:LysM repeat protein
MKGKLVLFIILLFPLTGIAQYKVFEDYVAKYHAIAVSEMHRTGVPASIKLAQGLLESNAGRSELATRANNHFGIKCSNNWNGNTFYKEDDDYIDGKLIKSCFRAFRDVEESYIAHSEFLRDPAKINRYGFLFHLPTTSYKEWAHGLKKAGYATDPNYGNRLIKIIEDYQLYQYDAKVTPMDVPVVADLGAKGTNRSQVRLPQKIVFNNGVRMIYTKGGESVAQIASRIKISEERILRYNEGLSSITQVPAYGERVYVSRKRTHYRGKQDWHYIQEGETVYFVAQLYGIQLSNLHSKNRLKSGEEPAVGTRLKLKGKRIKKSERPVLRSKETNVLPEQPLETSPDKDHVVPNIQESMTGNLHYHKVEPGDTLYQISRKYNVSVEDLRTLNNLESDLIKTGQVLTIR